MRLKELLIFLIMVALLMPLMESAVYSQEEELDLRIEEDVAGWVAAGDSLPLPPGETLGRILHPLVAENFTSARMVNDLFSFRDTLWIGTGGGLFVLPVSGDSVFPLDQTASRSITAINSDYSGRLWVGGDNGLSIRGEEGWLHYNRASYPFFEKVTDIINGENGMWISTYGHGVILIRGDIITVYSRSDSLLDNRVLTVFEKTPSKILFGTASGLCAADSFSWKPMRYGRNIPIGPVSDIAMDEQGRVFLAIERQGVTVLDLGRVKVYGIRRGLPGGNVHAFSLGPDGFIWAACDGGTGYFDGSGWRRYQVEGYELGGRNFRSIHHDLAGNKYLGDSEGRVVRISQYGAEELLIPQDFPSDHVEVRGDKQGGIFFITPVQVLELEGEGIERLELPHRWCRGSVTDAVELGDGTIWMATRFGILRKWRGNWEVFDRRQGLPTEHFVAVQPDSAGRVWFGTYDSGIMAYEGNRWVHYSGDRSLPGNHVEDLEVDAEGSVWAIVDGVATRFREGLWKEISINPSPRLESQPPDTSGSAYLGSGIRLLPDGGETEQQGESVISPALGLDHHGNILIAGDEGIYRLSGGRWQMLKYPNISGGIVPTDVYSSSRGGMFLCTRESGLLIYRRGRWEKPGVRDGIYDDHIISIVEDGEGCIWIGTNNGGVTRMKFRGIE